MVTSVRKNIQFPIHTPITAPHFHKQAALPKWVCTEMMPGLTLSHRRPVHSYPHAQKNNNDN